MGSRCVVRATGYVTAGQNIYPGSASGDDPSARLPPTDIGLGCV